MKRAAILALVLVLGIGLAGTAHGQAFQSYGVSFPPGAITAGPDKVLWFVGAVSGSGGRLGRITTSGSFTEYCVRDGAALSPAPCTSDDVAIYDVAAGPGDTLWFTDQDLSGIGRIGRLDLTTFVVNFYPLPAPCVPHSITSGPNNQMLFAEWCDPSPIGRVGAIDPSTGQIVRDLSLDLVHEPHPTAITCCPDNNIWFGGTAGVIYILTPAFEVGNFLIPNGGQIQATASGPDGATWFADDAHHIGRFRFLGAPQVDLYTADAAGIVLGADLNIWFTDRFTNAIGRITTGIGGPRGLTNEFPVPSPFAAPSGIALGPDNAVWFTDPVAVQVGTVTDCCPPTILSADHVTFFADSLSSNTFTVSAQSSETLTWTMTGALPQGVFFTGNYDGTATLSGSPDHNSTGVYVVMLTATDTHQRSVTQTFTLSVDFFTPTPSFDSVQTPDGDQPTVILSSSDSNPNCKFVRAAFVPVFAAWGDPRSPLISPPVGLTFPKELFEFKTTGCTLGADVFVTMNYQMAVPAPQLPYFNFGPRSGFSANWYQFPNSNVMEASGTSLQIKITDGGVGDDDMTKDGSVISAGGPAVPDPPLITNGPLVTWLYIGTPFDYTLMATGFQPIAFTVIGALPPGLVLDPATGEISGTPTTAGTFTGTITASNVSPVVASTIFQIVVYPAAPQFQSWYTTTFLVGTPGTFTVSATGTPTPTLTMTGALPSGVSFVNNNDGTGSLAGKPAAGTSGVYLLFFTASNAGPGGPYVTQSFLFVVEIPPTSVFQGTTVPFGENATATLTGGGPGGTTTTCQFSQAAFVGAQGDVRYPPTPSLSGALFPKGLFKFVTTGQCDQSAIQIVLAYPTPVPAVYWKYGLQPGQVSPVWYQFAGAVISGNTVTLTISDGGDGDDDGVVNGVITDPGGPAVISTTLIPPAFTNGPPLANATVGTPYTFTYTASGTAPVYFSLPAPWLPDGLSLSPAGVISGTPTREGVFNVRVTASNGTAPDATQSFTITVAPSASFSGQTSTGEPASAAITGGGPDCMFSQAAFIPLTGDPLSPPPPPPNATFPKGLFNFVTSGVCNQSQITVVLTYATNLPAGTVFWKYGLQPGQTSPSWYPFPGAVISGNTVTLTISDGGQGDDDGFANGVIVDPGGPVIPGSSSVPPSFTNGPPPATATVGTPYSFTYTASGTAPITFSVAGALPDGLSLSSAGAITGTPTKAGTFTGTVTATNGTAPDATQGFSITVGAAPSADVAIGKSVDNASPDVGQNVVFTISASDNGPSDASGLAVTDLLPAGLSFVSATASQGSYDSSSGVWNVGSLANGASAKLAITATVTQTGSIVNTATKTAQTEADPNTANDSATASINGLPSADVGVGLAVDSASPDVGDNVVFTVTASNAGPQDASGVQITDLLPAGVSFVSASPSQGSYDSVSGIWSVGAIAKNGSASLAITALVKQSGSITDTASRTAENEADLNPANDQKSVTISGQASADVRLSKSVSNASPHIGDQVTYTITASDDGPSPASGVQVIDLLPAGLAFVSASPSQGSYDSSTGLWDVGALAKNASATLSIVATVSQTGAITNTASKSAQAELDPNPSNDKASAAITASGVAPAITTQPSNQTVCAGQSVSFVSSASGNPTPTVQWQISVNGGASFSDIPGAASGTLSFAAAASDNGKQYRAVFTNSAGSAMSNAASLMVNTAPAITTQPTSQKVGAGQSVSFTAAASGSPAPSVQWQVSSNGGASFSDIPGASSSTLSFTASSSQNGYLYRAVFTNTCGSATSNAAILTVTTGCTITINPPTLHAATAGRLFLQELSVPGESEHVTKFSLADGAPEWLVLKGHTLFGRPPAPGEVTFTVNVMDAKGCTGSRSYTLEIHCPEIVLFPDALHEGIVGRSYSHAIYEYGGLGPATFAVTDGSLPPGLSLVAPADGSPRRARASLAMLAGTPTKAGNYTFTITATDSKGCTGSRRYKLVISTGRNGE